jgi:hypothetical protein
MPVAIEALPMWFARRRQPLSDWVGGVAMICD